MDTPQKQPSKAVQIRVFTNQEPYQTEGQIFPGRSTALAYLRDSLRTAGLLLDDPCEGREGDADPYAFLVPWHRVREVDIVPCYEDKP